MKNFTYYRPTSAEQAVGMLDAKWGTTELLAGGTDLLDLQKEYVAQPDKVVSLGGLGEAFTKIEVRVPPGRIPPLFIIGAGVKLADLAAHKDLRASLPALTTPAGDIG